MSEIATPLALAVSVAGLSKAYRLYRRPSDRLRELLWPRRQRGKVFWALRDVSLAIPQGQVLGLIGPNGSGKSTLLQLIAGVLQPTSGAVAAHGRVTALLELGAGFNPEFTGRENIMLNATLLGLSEAEARAHTPEIIEFAGIGQFLDQPVKTYSSGMYVRLAFAIAVSVQPDILIVDEALAVGDAYFQQRCMRRMRQFRDEGKTIIFVSHDTAAVKALCDRAIMLREGQIVDDGRPGEVVQHYLTVLEAQSFERPAAEVAQAPVVTSGEAEGLGDDPAIERELPNVDARHGSGAARIVGVGCYDEAGRRSDSLMTGEALTVRVSVRFLAAVARPNVGFVLRDRLGTDLAGTNCVLEGVELPTAEAGAVYTVEFKMALPELHPGPYAISPTVADGDLTDYTMCDWVENARTMQIGGEYRSGCVMHPEVAVALVGVRRATGSS